LAVLHEGDHAAFVPDSEERQHQQDHEREQCLEQHHPPFLVEEDLKIE
jgi:hypothetical protein